jgi:very-short-patch-repair endonuclease
MPVKNPSTTLRTGIIPGQTVTKEKLECAKELRRNMTPAEKILWQELRANKLGVRFRRQQVIAGFIVDFYCHKAALVIEVDGDIHDLQQDEDARRENALREGGLRIVRFRNDEVLKNLSEVVEQIKNLVLCKKKKAPSFREALKWRYDPLCPSDISPKYDNENFG